MEIYDMYKDDELAKINGEEIGEGIDDLDA
jgi:hypothetical protein